MNEGNTVMENAARILPVVKHLYRRYAHDAAKRGKKFMITVEYFNTIIHEPCAYCGVVEDGTYTQSQYAVKVVKYNGVDRVDSSADYTDDNTVACCGACNAAKSNRDVAFLSSEWLKNRIAMVKGA